MFARQLLRRIALHPGQEMVMMYLWDLGPQRQADLVLWVPIIASMQVRTVLRSDRA
jgi:hypothetical protein